MIKNFTPLHGATHPQNLRPPGAPWPPAPSPWPPVYNRLALITRSRAGLFASTTGAVIILGLLWARAAFHRGAPAPPRVSIHPSRILADGSDLATLLIDAPQAAGRPAISIVENPHGAMIQGIERQDKHWQAQIRAGINPGRIALRIEFPGLPPAAAELTSAPAAADSFEDGTPDFLRLDDNDRQTFRRWFTWLAEAQYFQAPANRPAEIDDCAALIRYAYREALRAHESGWAEAARVPVVPAFAPIGKYQYPYTPLGAALFRVRAGPYLPSDLTGGAFAQFADAQTLWRFNTYALGRDLRHALPGDLLFFRHEAGRMPFHSMIYLGESQFRRDGNRYVLYHTGPDGTDPGEIRRLTLLELIHYPQPEWRPVPGNPGFLGVFRWNILRKAFENEDAPHN
ncbi:conserved hypothetical protein [Candidatus Sulfopaludibacter sp. SbA6]|nr:conserved hypothetical protein [Candidatus Sulfopaludibacter sp. SbA6]